MRSGAWRSAAVGFPGCRQVARRSPLPPFGWLQKGLRSCRHPTREWLNRGLHCSKSGCPPWPHGRVQEGGRGMGVIIGVDPHKASCTAAVLDERGELVDQQRFASTRTGWRALGRWAKRWPERRWAVEGASGLGRRLAQQLVGEGEPVVDVPAKLAARVRLLSAGHGRKSDAHDAVSVAVAALGATRPGQVRLEDHAGYPPRRKLSVVLEADLAKGAWPHGRPRRPRQASWASLLRPWPADSSRTRAASLAGTSTTGSPSPTSCWASLRPRPLGALNGPAPLGPALGPAAQRPPVGRGSGEPLLINQFAARSLSTATVQLALKGSTPMITHPSHDLPPGPDREAREGNPTWSSAILC